MRHHPFWLDRVPARRRPSYPRFRGEIDVPVVIVGGGLTGCACAVTFATAGVRAIVLEARARIGGRAWTIAVGGVPLDLGCGWLHSANRNPWSGLVREMGLHIDKTPPPWTRPSLPIGFPIEDQKAFRAALDAFYDRVHEVAQTGKDTSRCRTVCVRAIAGTA